MEVVSADVWEGVRIDMLGTVLGEMARAGGRAMAKRKKRVGTRLATIGNAMQRPVRGSTGNRAVKATRKVKQYK